MRKPTQTHREHETPHRKALGMIKTQTLSCCVTKALFTEPPCRLHLLRESLRKSMIHCSDIWSISVIFQTARLNTSSFFSTKMFLFWVGHFSNQGKHLGELFLQCGGKKTTQHSNLSNVLVLPTQQWKCLLGAFNSWKHHFIISITSYLCKKKNQVKLFLKLC